LYGRYTNVEHPGEWVTEYRFADLGDSRCQGGSAIDLSAVDALWEEPLPVMDDNLHRPIAVPGRGAPGKVNGKRSLSMLGERAVPATSAESSDKILLIDDATSEPHEAAKRDQLFAVAAPTSTGFCR
jgi:hypothetical protein